MARQLIVVALIFFAIVGMASAVADAPAAGAGSSIPAQGPSTDNSVIGNTDGSSDSEAAPIGGPVSPETFPKVPLAEGPGASAASSLDLTSAGAILTSFAGAFFF